MGALKQTGLWGGAFDWKIGKVNGAEISFDDSVFFEGKRSLKITFNGKENVDFQQIGQVVAWKPDTGYCLKAHMKTKGITTKSGLKIEISGIGEAFYGASESLTGDNDWKELTVTFRTPAPSQGGQVRVKREKINKFDRLISGEVWIDNLQLSEEPSRH
jgi:Carbohydrate binding domain